MSTWLRTRVVPLAISVRMSAEARASIGKRDAMAFDALGGDPLAHAASLDMGQTRRAPMRLVEMDVTVDERRQEERAREIDALAGRIGASGRMQRRNAAAGDFDVGERRHRGRRALARIIRRGSAASPPHIDRADRRNA